MSVLHFASPSFCIVSCIPPLSRITPLDFLSCRLPAFLSFCNLKIKAKELQVLLPAAKAAIRAAFPETWKVPHQTPFQVVFPSGTLGLGLGYQSESESNSMIVIMKVYLDCPQADYVQVGNRLVSFDDWPLVGKSLQEITVELGKNRHRSHLLLFTRS